MKKILVVLLVLAVTAGAFAQWTLGADGRVATALNFHTAQDDDNHPLAQLWKDSYGQLVIGYTKGIVTTSLDFKTRAANDNLQNYAWDNKGRIAGSFKINGENYAFNAGVNMNNILVGSAEVDKLWGSYNFLNGLLYVEVSAKDWGGKSWMADNAVDRNIADKVNGNLISGNRNHLLFNVSFPVGFQFGFYINDLFSSFLRAVDPDDPDHNPTSTSDNIEWGGTFLIDNGETNSYYSQMSVINSLVAGAKFDIGNFNVAAQFSTRDFQTYFGATGTFGPVTAGLSFWGAFPEISDSADSPVGANPSIDTTSAIRVGASVSFNGGFFGVGAKAILGLYKDTVGTIHKIDWYGDSTNKMTLALEPNIWIDAVASYLRFTLNAGFYFNTPQSKDEADVTWKVNPVATWNFLGTGAGTWSTGFQLDYLFKSAVSDDKVNTNRLKIGFSWSL